MPFQGPGCVGPSRRILDPCFALAVDVRVCRGLQHAVGKPGGAEASSSPARHCADRLLRSGQPCCDQRRRRP